MSSPGPFSGKGYLRRSLSTRTIRKGSRRHQSSAGSEPWDLDDDARRQATAAASLAMRRSADRSSTESRRSYDCVGGPSSLAVPPRRCQPTRHSEPSDDLHPPHAVEHNHPSRDQNWTSPAALPSIHEFGGLDGQNASLSSSYRRLRKTRSLFAPRQHFSQIPYGASPGPDIPPDTAREGTLRRSMSFLRGSQPSADSRRHADHQEAAIQLARAEFQTTYGLNRRSSLLTLKPRREYRPFRKTFRTASGSGVDASGSPLAERHSSSGRARSFSHSIKRGIKRVLGWSRPPCDPGDLQSSPLQPQGQENLSTGSMPWHQAPPFNTTTAPDKLHTIRDRPSVESLASTASRVTSWTDSTIVNTGTARRSGEPGHLSIIPERGSANQKPTQQMSAETPSTPSPLGPRGAIDSQRLYTALMRRIGRTAAQGSEEDIVLGRVQEHRAIPTRDSSLYPRRSRQTIRPVPSEESITSPGSFATAWASFITPQKASSVIATKTSKKEDDRSSLVTLPRPFKDSDASLSVYSRTTSGNSPTTVDNMSSMSLPGPDDDQEPGIATIFESQRAPYSSPNRASRAPNARSTQPSADWQQWVSTQMERIETMVPAGGHYREEAQLHAEATDIFQMKDASDLRTRRDENTLDSPGEEAIARTRVTASMNFSRPFSRASSARTITLTENEPTPKAILPSSSVSPNSPTPAGVAVHRTRPRDDVFARSPMQLRPTNRFPPPESPTPKRSPDGMPERLKRSMRYGGSAVHLAANPSGSRVLSQRSLRGNRDAGQWTNENLKTEGPADLKDFYSPSPKVASPMSSKRMVEMFLDSRRRHMESNTSEGAVSEEAFI